MAEEAELDLVEVSPTAKPPVCRIMDYGKFLFEKNKQRQVAKKKQKQVQIKEVKFRPGTEEGDYQVKLRNLVRFLNEGDKAKITLRFRGRWPTRSSGSSCSTGLSRTSSSSARWNSARAWKAGRWSW
jgi:translation initiation factor IF-3